MWWLGHPESERRRATVFSLMAQWRSSNGEANDTVSEKEVTVNGPRAPLQIQLPHSV